MKDNNIVIQKSYAFAVSIVKTYQVLSKVNREYVLSKQLLKSGTSIGANIEEAIGGQSDKDFYSKLSIAYKECRETRYWIRLLTDTSYLSNDQSISLMLNVEELLKIIGAIQVTMKKKMNSNYEFQIPNSNSHQRNS
jgi:four helix bundle protein